MHLLVLSRYLALPLRGESLLLVILFSTGMTIGEHMGLYGILLFVALGSWFFKYSFALLDHVVAGHRGAPVMSAEMINPMEQRPLGLLALLVAFFALTSWLQPFVGDKWTFVLRIGGLALLPAMLATVAVTQHFVQALNPVSVIGTIARIPLAYGALLLMIGALWYLPVTIALGAADRLAALWDPQTFFPGGLLVATGGKSLWVGWLAHVLFMYVWLAMFACVGGLVYECRHELGIEPAQSPERKAARAQAEVDRERDKVFDRIFAQARGGAFRNAEHALRQLTEQATDPLDECRWLYERARTANAELANCVARLALPRLLEIRATGEALRMVQERLAADVQFKPATGEELRQLAQLARDGGDRPTARRLLVDFERRFPNDAAEAWLSRLRSELQR